MSPSILSTSFLDGTRLAVISTASPPITPRWPRAFFPNSFFNPHLELTVYDVSKLRPQEGPDTNGRGL